MRSMRKFVGIARFQIAAEIPLLEFVDAGSKALNLKSQEASNMVQSMLRQAWNRMCRDKGLLEYAYSAAVGFHASSAQVKVGQKFHGASRATGGRQCFATLLRDTFGSSA